MKKNKLWEKGYSVHELIETFTVGNDYVLDNDLLEFDCIASKAHCSVLFKANILTSDESATLRASLDEIRELHKKGKFPILPSHEDCHTAIEEYLTKKHGDIGKKIHSARSRNDQVLTAIRLYEKSKIEEVKELVQEHIVVIEEKIKTLGDIEIPGYTHMQQAMPTNVSTWLGSFKDAFEADKALLSHVFKTIDQNPLGSAAGFGVPVLEIDREVSTKELGFQKTQENPLYCQLSRGKFESMLLSALRQVMFTLNKLSTDILLFTMKEFGVITLPKEFCTGSSIMPQKVNADPFELIRGHYSTLLGYELQVNSLISNLISGYNRDMQLSKEPVLNSFKVASQALAVSTLVVQGLSVDRERTKEVISKEIYATHEAYSLVKSGIPFRDAYKKVAREIVSKKT